MVNSDFFYLTDYYCSKEDGLPGPQGSAGKQGRPGKNGKTGPQGHTGPDGMDLYLDEGVYGLTLFCVSDTTPELPPNGEISVDTEREELSGLIGVWVVSDEFDFENLDTKTVWLCYGVANTGAGFYNFNGPYRISGPDGIDRDRIQFIYKQTNKKKEEEETPTSDNYVSKGWTEYPKGLFGDDGKVWKYELYTWRIKSNGEWGEFASIEYYAVLGVDGDDGNGIEYIYALGKGRGDVPEISIPSDWETNEEYQNSNYIPKGWHDNPQKIGEGNKVQFFSVRRYIDGVWGKFASPRVWNEYLPFKGEDGVSLTYCGEFTDFADFEPYFNDKNVTVIGDEILDPGDYYIVEGSMYVFKGVGEGFEKYYFLGSEINSMVLYVLYASKIGGKNSTNDEFEIIDPSGDDLGKIKFIGTLVTDDPEDASVFRNYTWCYFKGEDGYGIEYVFTRTKDGKAPERPVSAHKDNPLPIGTLNWHGMDSNGVVWTDDPMGVDQVYTHEWYCKRYQMGPYSKTRLFGSYNYADGSIGKNGLILYPRGVWSEDEVYERTEYATPYVIYMHEGEKGYYYFNNDGVEGKGNSELTPFESADRDEGTWVEIEAKDGIFTKILLADNALLGQCVFNGDWIFSQTGVDKNGNLSLEYENFFPVDPYYLEKGWDEYVSEGINVPSKIFKPSVAFNFKTGEVFLCDGRIRMTREELFVITDQRGNKMFYFDEYDNLNIVCDIYKNPVEIESDGDFFKCFIPAPLASNEYDWNTYLYNTLNQLSAEVTGCDVEDVDGIASFNPYYCNGNVSNVYPYGHKSVSPLINNSYWSSISGETFVIDGVSTDTQKMVCVSFDALSCDCLVKINKDIVLDSHYNLPSKEGFALTIFMPMMSYENVWYHEPEGLTPSVIRTPTSIGGEWHYITFEELLLLIGHGVTFRNGSGNDVIVITANNNGEFSGTRIADKEEVRFVLERETVGYGGVDNLASNLIWRVEYRKIYGSGDFGMDGGLETEQQDPIVGVVEDGGGIVIDLSDELLGDGFSLRYLDSTGKPLVDESDITIEW